jgi:uncharacterized membrane protein YedE/YeeE
LADRTKPIKRGDGHLCSLFLFKRLLGTLIGLVAILLMLANGRVVGISGIVSTAISSFSRHDLWRWAIIVGLVVGIGTQIGSGCASGHGICGIGRLSKRSIVATVTFMLSAMLTMAFVKHFL